MKTYVQHSDDNVTRIITEIYVNDVEDLSKSEHQFKLVMQQVAHNMAKAIGDELTPRIQEAILSRIDIDQMVQDAARAKVKDLLWPTIAAPSR